MVNNSSGYWAMLLRECQEQAALASVYTDPESPDDFCVGYVEALNARQLALRSIGMDGSPDGWLLVRLQDVLQVLAGEEYEQRLSWLIQLAGATHNAPFLTAPEDDDLFRQYLRRAGEAENVVTIWMTDVEEGVTGRVKAVDDLRVTLEAYDFFGQTSYTDAFSISRLEAVCIDGADERMYARMHDNTPPGTLRLI